jgi:predicted O-methyltransferase YrrM
MDDQKRWDDVDNYFAGKLVGQDEALDGALEASAAAGLPPISVSPLQGKFLNLLARLMGAHRVLEIGSLGGYSAIWLARALPAAPEGKLISLEVEPRHAEVARANIARAGLSGTAEVVVGAALDTLPQLSKQVGPASFDLTFIDADKPNNPAYFKWALELTRPGGAIVVDNVVRDGQVADAGSSDPTVVGTRQLVDTVVGAPGVSATAIQTVGTKGYDGFAIAIVPSSGSPA